MNIWEISGGEEMFLGLVICRLTKVFMYFTLDSRNTLI